MGASLRLPVFAALCCPLIAVLRLTMHFLTGLAFLASLRAAAAHGGHGEHVEGETLQQYAQRHVRSNQASHTSPTLTDVFTGCAQCRWPLSTTCKQQRGTKHVCRHLLFPCSDTFDVPSFFHLHDLNRCVVPPSSYAPHLLRQPHSDKVWDADEIQAVYGVHHIYSQKKSKVRASRRAPQAGVLRADGTG